MTLSQLRLCLLALAMGATRAAADNWPAWRGADGNGHCKERDLPLKWSKDENIRWNMQLPEPGNSTPVIWGNRLFLTQSENKGQKRSLMCLDRKDGKTLWTKTVEFSGKEPTHKDNYFCSASPVTDGERVVVWHGSAGMYCYDFQGKELWKQELGPCLHIWGNASSPVIHGDLVYLNFGPGERTFLLAADKKTGKEVWKIEEPGGKVGDKGRSEWIGSWSTPIIAKTGNPEAPPHREELILSWPGIVKSFDPKKGTLLWSCKGLERDKEPDRLVYTTPLVTTDAVVAMAGFGGPAIGVKTGGSGDVTETHRLWRHPSAPQRIGSGVIVGEHVYMLNENGMAQCIEVKSGKLLWSERVGKGTWSNIVYADGRLYVPNLDGETFVLAAKPKFEVLARNPLGEGTMASLAVSDGELFLRTHKSLWCISSKK